MSFLKNMEFKIIKIKLQGAFTMKNYFFLKLFFALFLTGCVGGGQVDVQPYSEAKNQPSQEIKQINSKLSVKRSSHSGTASGYLIGPEDLIEVDVYETDRLDIAVRISQKGEATLPLIGIIRLEGLTAREAEVAIADELRNGGYVDTPNVTVFIRERNSKIVSVLGSVVAPGDYELLVNQTLVDTLADAKGLTDDAGTIVQVTRDETDGSKTTYLVDLDRLLEKGDPGLDMELMPGDLVYVPEAANIFVEGAVFNPGSYPVAEGKTTVSEAIVMAGGTLSFANKGNITLIRNLDNGSRQSVALNLNKIRNGQMNDPVLNEKDVVIVGASGFKKFFYGLRINALGFGGGYTPPAR